MEQMVTGILRIRWIATAGFAATVAHAAGWDKA